MRLFTKFMQAFDRNVTRTVSKDELRDILKDFGETFTEEELEELFNDANKNGDGMISYESYNAESGTRLTT